jgi:hypothetical protein
MQLRPPAKKKAPLKAASEDDEEPAEMTGAENNPRLEKDEC